MKREQAGAAGSGVTPGDVAQASNLRYSPAAPRRAGGVGREMLVVLCGWALALAGHAAPPVTRGPFGTLPDGTAVEVCTLTNARGSTAKILTYGAILADLRVPDRHGKFAGVVNEITPTPENFQRGFPQAAAVMGRVTNRIAGARFTLDGRDYPLAANAGPHHIHGGVKGFSKVNWRIVPTDSLSSVSSAAPGCSPPSSSPRSSPRPSSA